MHKPSGLADSKDSRMSSKLPYHSTQVLLSLALSLPRVPTSTASGVCGIPLPPERSPHRPIGPEFRQHPVSAMISERSRPATVPKHYFGRWPSASTRMSICPG